MDLDVMFAAAAGGVVASLSTFAAHMWWPHWQPRYPVALGAVVGAVICWRFGTDLPLMFVFGWWCAMISAVDLGTRRLPNVLTAAGAVASGSWGVVSGYGLEWLVGAVCLFGAYLLIHLLAPASFGAGDVKLAWSLGGVVAVAGVDAWLVAAVLAPLITACIGLVFIVRGRRDVRIPHGPSMCGATLLALAACLS